MTRTRLQQYTNLIAERDSIKTTLAEMEGTIYAPATQNMDGMPRSSSGFGSSVERAAISHAELSDRLRVVLAQIGEEALEIERAIESLPARERNLMRMHYIDGVSWEEVAQRTCYCLRQVYRIRRQALEMLETA